MNNLQSIRADAQITMVLGGLPLEIIYRILNILEFEDQVCLGLTSHWWHYLILDHYRTPSILRAFGSFDWCAVGHGARRDKRKIVRRLSGWMPQMYVICYVCQERWILKPKECSGCKKRSEISRLAKLEPQQVWPAS